MGAAGALPGQSTAAAIIFFLARVHSLATSRAASLACYPAPSSKVMAAWPFSAMAGAPVELAVFMAGFTRRLSPSSFMCTWLASSCSCSRTRQWSRLGFHLAEPRPPSAAARRSSWPDRLGPPPTALVAPSGARELPLASPPLSAAGEPSSAGNRRARPSPLLPIAWRTAFKN